MDYLDMTDESEQEMYSRNEFDDLCECFLGPDEEYFENIYKQSIKSIDN